MKKTICLLLALCCVLSLCACGTSSSKKIFVDMIFENPTEEGVYKVLGTDYEIPSGYPWSREYQNVELYTLKGDVSVGVMSLDPPITIYWQYNKGDETKDEYEKIVKKFIKDLDGRYGKHTFEDDEYIWRGLSGHEYSLNTFSDCFEFSAY